MIRFLVVFIFLLPLRASDPPREEALPPSEYVVVEKIIHQLPPPPAKALLSEKLALRILNDDGRLMDPAFKASPYFAPFVRFWFSIYTRYSSDHLVVHDKSDLTVIYSVLDFSQTRGEGLSRFARAHLMQKLSASKLAEIRQVLLALGNGDTTHRQSLEVLQILQASNRPPPQPGVHRKKYFQKRADDLRSQTGQRNLIEEGLVAVAPLAPYFRKLFAAFEMPPQLLALPFLESSFNIKAHSKSGALGVWQFMPLISSYFMPKRSALVDYRKNPLISSVAALHLLRENKNILNTWDLAITAYNSGTKHLVKARRKLGANSLEEILRGYQHPHLGFASKNFYSEFLALVYMLTYRDEVFPEERNVATLPVEQLWFGVAKCAFTPSKLSLGGPSAIQRWKEINPHLENFSKPHPRGTLVVLYGKIDRLFLRLTLDQVASTKPIQWTKRWLKNQSCSTK